MKKGIIVVGAALWLLMVAGQSTGEMKITPDGVTFPNASTQTMAATPPWSQLLAAADRFQYVLAGHFVYTNFVYDAVLDKETGLVWQRGTDSTKRNWWDACSYCYNLSLGGRKGWRLPTVEELASLVDPNQTDPSLPVGHLFTDVKLDAYWSSSSDAYNAGSAWWVGFINGYVGSNMVEGTFYVRCVRGGHGYDTQ